MRVGIDVGGTFTDLALWDGKRLSTTKVPTTPADQSEGVVAALEAGQVRDASLVHGTTAATNALLERSGAHTALVTDEGFEDLLEIGRQDRPSLYDTSEVRAMPLVESNDRIGVPGRASLGGSAKPEDLSRTVDRVVDVAPEAVAISCLFSFDDPSRESEIETAIASALPDVAISRSSQVAPEFREYERTSTTVINAYLTPVVAGYLERLGRVAGSAGVVGEPTVMRSSGGLIDLPGASQLPASIVLSGPAGGVVAAAALGSALGRTSLVSFDMGGTSTDVCRITDGYPEVAFEQRIDGLPNRMPSVAVHTVGAGGGSLAWVDDGGALRVGPRSAGAVPGPAAYGRGGEQPTVTDANLIAGRLADAAALGSSVRLNGALADRALTRVGEVLDLSPETVAAGIIEIVESHMERAVRVVSIEQGTDPRGAELVAFGGAGALHATALARRLDMAGVLVPPHAGVFSAFGLLLAPPRSDVVRGVLLSPDDQTLGAAVASVTAEASRRLAEAPEHVDSFADVRYRGQSHEISVPLAAGDSWSEVAQRFHDLHQTRNGFARVSDPIEVVAVRAAAVGRPAFTFEQLPPQDATGDPDRGTRPVLESGIPLEAAVVWRPALAVGSEVIGPAVIEEPEATTYLSAGERAVVHESGTLEVSW